jgi:hypothetical protein
LFIDHLLSQAFDDFGMFFSEVGGFGGVYFEVVEFWRGGDFVGEFEFPVAAAVGLEAVGEVEEEVCTVARFVLEEERGEVFAVYGFVGSLRAGEGEEGGEAV